MAEPKKYSDEQLKKVLDKWLNIAAYNFKNDAGKFLNLAQQKKIRIDYPKSENKPDPLTEEEVNILEQGIKERTTAELKKIYAGYHEKAMGSIIQAHFLNHTERSERASFVKKTAIKSTDSFLTALAKVLNYEHLLGTYAEYKSEFLKQKKAEEKKPESLQKKEDNKTMHILFKGDEGSALNVIFKELQQREKSEPTNIISLLLQTLANALKNFVRKLSGREQDINPIPHMQAEVPEHYKNSESQTKVTTSGSRSKLSEASSHTPGRNFAKRRDASHNVLSTKKDEPERRTSPKSP